jgi:hypothetical protein
MSHAQIERKQETMADRAIEHNSHIHCQKSKPWDIYKMKGRQHQHYSLGGFVERNSTHAATIDVDTTVNVTCVFHPV